MRQLTHSTGGKVNNGANSWSPDGRKISFIWNRDGEYGVYTMNADGTGVKKLTKDPGRPVRVGLPPLGRRIEPSASPRHDCHVSRKA